MRFGVTAHTRSVIALLLVTFASGPGAPQPAVAQDSTPVLPTQAARRGADKPELSPDRIIVKFKERTTASQRDNARRQEQLEKVRPLGLIRAELVKVRGRTPDAAIAALERRPDVEYAEPDYIRRASSYETEPYIGYLWGQHNNGQYIGEQYGSADVDINGLEASQVMTGAASTTVAVIDEGIDFSHPDLSGQQWVNPDEIAGNGWDDDGNGYVDDINGWDFYNWDNTVYDSYDGDAHGTHVAGTIAAKLDGQGVVGVAPNVKIMSLKFLGPDGGWDSDAISAIEYAAREGVKISNNSWGGGDYNQALKDAIDNCGCLLVAAAGNGGADGIGDNNDYYPDYPASYTSPNILSVAAVDNQGNLADFSNYGPASVDISAPGVGIASTYPEGEYVWMSGTSMAAPHATGVAALVASLNPTLTATEIKSALLNTGKASPYTSGWTVTGKMLDAYAAVTSIAPAPSDTTSPSGTVKISSGATYQQRDGECFGAGYR